MHGPNEVGFGDRSPLVTGDRDQWHFAKSDIERLEVGTVLSAVKSSHRAICHLRKKRKMKLIDVKMQNVELFRELTYPVKHQHVIGDRVTDIAVETQCHGCATHQLGSGDGVRACEQGHLVPVIGRSPFRYNVLVARHLPAGPDNGLSASISSAASGLPVCSLLRRKRLACRSASALQLLARRGS
jgi:hypothetical protein